MLINVSDISIEKPISDEDTMLTSFLYFSDLLWPFSTDARNAKGADIGDDCIKNISVGGICTRGTCIGGTYTSGACIRGTSLRGAGVKVVCIRSACASNTYARSTYAKSACIDSINTVKHLKIHSQSFQILEIGDTRTKIRVGACWWLLYIVRILYQSTSNAVNALLNDVIIGAADAKDASAKGFGAKSASIKNAGTKIICIKDTYIKSTCFRDACNDGACTEGTCARSVSAVKQLEMYLQSFWISEVKLFETRLETGVRVSWWLLNLLQILH